MPVALVDAGAPVQPLLDAEPHRQRFRQKMRKNVFSFSQIVHSLFYSKILAGNFWFRSVIPFYRSDGNAL